MSCQFYKFYDFTYSQGYPPFRALVQSQLKSNVRKLSKLYPQWSEDDFIEYFRQVMLDDSYIDSERRLAHWHLVAYVDKQRCESIYHQYSRLPFYPAQSEKFYGWTNEVLFNREKFTKHLDKYSSQHQSKASFSTYIVGVLKNSIREKLDDLESDWHLLCDIDTSSTRKIKNAAKKLREALNNYGITEPRISQYIFAWQYFVFIYKKNNVYSSNNSRWNSPKNSDFGEAASNYNSQKKQSNAPLQVSSSFIATSEIIKEWMETCIKALRQHKRITEISRDRNDYQKKEEIKSESFSDTENESLLLEVEEFLREKIEIIEANLPRIHQKISLKSSKAIMLLAYSNHLAIFNQQQLADWLGINQGTISRYISHQIQKPLLHKFQNILVSYFNISSYLDIFLVNRFTNPNHSLLDSMLSESFYDLEDRQKRVLKLLYGEQKEISEVRVLLNDRSLDIERIQAIKQKLQIIFQAKINKWQKSYIKFWLYRYYENRIREVLLKGFTRLDSLNQKLIKKRYCNKLDEIEINKRYPEYQVRLMLEESTERLKDFLIQWFNSSFQIELKGKDSQIIEIVESWLSREFIYLEI